MTIERRVWGIGTPRTLRPQWTLIELGLEYEHQKVLPRGGGMEASGLLALNPRHKVPFYQDDRVAIGESAAITYYLADRYPDQGLAMPEANSPERAVLYDRMFYIMTEIDSRAYTIRLHDDPPAGLSETYGSAPVAVDAARDYVTRGLTESARWFDDGREFAMGDGFGMIDILLTSCLDMSVSYAIALPDTLSEYRERIAARPGFQKAMAENDPENQ